MAAPPPRSFDAAAAREVMRRTHDAVRDAVLADLRAAASSSGGAGPDAAGSDVDAQTRRELASWRAVTQADGAAAAGSPTADSPPISSADGPGADVATLLARYPAAQHGMAAGVWQQREVQYVLDTVRAYWFGDDGDDDVDDAVDAAVVSSSPGPSPGTKRERDTPPSTTTKRPPRVCGAARDALKAWVAARIAAAADGAAPGPAAYRAEVRRLNAVWRLTSPPHMANAAPSGATVTEASPVPAPPTRVRLPDVGRCYTPFGRCAAGAATPAAAAGTARAQDDTAAQEAPWLDVTAVDLRPSAAAPEVLPCDWLNVRVVTTPADTGRPSIVAEATPAVTAVHAGSTDVVVMSFLLSFLPTPALRFRACATAVAALRPGGILVVVEARRGGQKQGAVSWPQRWSGALQRALGVRHWRLDTLKLAIGVVFVKPADGAPPHPVAPDAADVAALALDNE